MIRQGYIHQGKLHFKIYVCLDLNNIIKKLIWWDYGLIQIEKQEAKGIFDKLIRLWILLPGFVVYMTRWG